MSGDGSFKNYIEIFSILLKYNEEAYVLGAEHDTIHVYVSPKVVSDEDKEKLEELGCHVDSYNDGFYIFT